MQLKSDYVVMALRIKNMHGLSLPEAGLYVGAVFHQGISDGLQ